MLGVATLFYFGTLVLGGLTKMVIFSDYAISFCFLYGIFLYISFWQFSAAYSQLALSFGATRQSIRRAILVLWVVGSLFAEAFTVLAAQLSLWIPMNEPAGRNVFLLQCGLHPVGGFCLMLFLAATGSAAGTALPAAWPRTLCLTRQRSFCILWRLPRSLCLCCWRTFVRSGLCPTARRWSWLAAC